MSDNKDVSKAIQAKSDQLCADDLVGGPITIKIRDVKVIDGADQPIEVFYEGDNNKPWRPAKTAARCLAAIWGANASTWIGMHVTLYNDPTVKWAGVAVGGVRPSHMEGLDKPRTLQLSSTRGKKTAVTIQPLRMEKLTQPDAPDMTAEYQEDARNAAKQGSASLQSWWQMNNPKQQAAMLIMDELKTLRDTADQQALPVDDGEEELPM